MPVPTILAVGATGNIGVAAILAARKCQYNVLAIVRNQASADKLFQHVGSREGITTVEADVTSENGVQSVVDRVRAGELPAFQHVHSSCGAWIDTPLSEISVADFKKTMNINFDSNFYAYRATIPYLRENHEPSSFTQCTGAAPDFGAGGVTGASQGALFSMLKVASKENDKTNVRVNEIYLSARVDYDSVAEGKKGSIQASDFAKAYQGILEREDLKGARVTVHGKKDLEELKIAKLVSMSWSGSSS